MQVRGTRIIERGYAPKPSLPSRRRLNDNCNLGFSALVSVNNLFDETSCYCKSQSGPSGENRAVRPSDAGPSVPRGVSWAFDCNPSSAFGRKGACCNRSWWLSQGGLAEPTPVFSYPNCIATLPNCLTYVPSMLWVFL